MAKTSSGFLRTPRQIAFFLGFFALLGAAFSLAYPYVKKAGVIRDTGQATISALAPLSIAIAHYSVADISTMMGYSRYHTGVQITFGFTHRGV